MKRFKQDLLIAVGVVAVVVLLIMFALSGDNLDILKSLLVQDFSNEELSDHLRGFGWRGYITITAFATLQVLCTFLPAEPVQVLGGFTFGFPIGLLCCMIGVLLGNTLIYMLQNIYGDQLRRFFVKKLNLDLAKIAQSNKGVLIILILYFLPAIPYGMICFLAASMGMSYRKFITTTGLGALPSVCIGVGLGHMVMETDATVSICVFAVLLVLVAVMFYKREVMFAKINSFADRKKKASHKVQKANGFMMSILYWLIRFWIFLSGVRIKTNNKIGKLQGPAIVLCNHGSFIDFVYAAALLRKFKPHFIVARLYFYHSALGWALRKLGAFPKSMFAVDIENVRNCLTVLKDKEILAMMPEARLSTAGRFEDIQENTYSFIKKSEVNIYTVKINGDYLADPKWGKGFRRGALVEAELDILYTAEQVKNMTLDQLKQGIEERLFYDDFQWLQERPDVHYRSHNLAEGLENILSICPTCNRKHTIKTQKNKVFCEHCGYLTAMDDRYAFDAAFRFKNLAQWYDWQKSCIEKEITENENYALTSKVELRLPSDGKGLTRFGGNGICTLKRDGFTYTGTKDGENMQLSFSIQRVYRLLFGAGEDFELYDGTQIFYFVPEERRAAVDWYMASATLYDRFSEADN